MEKLLCHLIYIQVYFGFDILGRLWLQSFLILFCADPISSSVIDTLLIDWIINFKSVITKGSVQLQYFTYHIRKGLDLTVEWVSVDLYPCLPEIIILNHFLLKYLPLRILSYRELNDPLFSSSRLYIRWDACPYGQWHCYSMSLRSTWFKQWAKFKT